MRPPRSLRLRPRRLRLPRSGKSIGALAVVFVALVSSVTFAGDGKKGSSTDTDKARGRVRGAQPNGSKPLFDLLKETDDIAIRVSKLRGLPILKPIARGLMSREAITQRILARLDEEYSPSELLGEEQTYKRLGLLPVDEDYKRLIIDLLTSQLAGFYDPKAKELYLADWIGDSDDAGGGLDGMLAGLMQRVVVAHEIDHALQDQSFDLIKYMQSSKDNSDQQLARQAVVEGDGTVLMMEFLQMEMGIGEPLSWSNPAILDSFREPVIAQMMSGDLAKVPLFIRESMLFPYLAGLGLVASLRTRHPWSEVDKLFREPPLSTEQVIHPQKYLAAEKPVSVRPATIAALNRWRTVYRNVVGEFGWGKLLLQHGLSKERADQAAAGWGGDCLVAYAPANHAGVADLVVVSQSVWDAEGEAVEAFEATAEMLAKLTGDDQCVGPAAPSVLLMCSDSTKDVSFVERKGNRLVLVIGAAGEETATTLRAQLWAGWKASR
ncbi:MAG: hypothetical protein V2A73_18975 [Pseudomonadota bacterium]